MKTVPLVDADGYFVEDILVRGDRPFSGVTLHYKVDVDPPVRGYTVGYPIPQGLYKPKLDIERLTNNFGENPQSWPQGWNDEETSQYWIEGLSAEEIAEMKPVVLSEVEQMRHDIAEQNAEMWDFILSGGV